MISVHKAAVPPAILTAPAAVAARMALEQAYNANPAGCQQPGTPALKPLRRIYADRAVKRQLIADQHGKCAYCETRFVHSSPGDVEHYRPKAGYRQTASQAVQGPGYYWLAYEWSNLLFACEDCNRIRKRQLFPLSNDPAGRARSHHDDLSQEAPLLLNPATCAAPESHLTFVDEVAQGLTPAGKASVKAYDLNRVALLDDRREQLRCLRSEEVLSRIFELDPPAADLDRLVQAYGSEEELSRHIAQARRAHQRAAFAAAEYAGMVRANFPQLPTR
jgi:uncharacterized protein (TIGR02646 family)